VFVTACATPTRYDRRSLAAHSTSPLSTVACCRSRVLLTGFSAWGGGGFVLVLGFGMPAAVGTSLLVIAINCAAVHFQVFGGTRPGVPAAATPLQVVSTREIAWL